MAISLHSRVLSGVSTGTTTASFTFAAPVSLGEAVLIGIGWPTITLPTIVSVTDDSAIPNTWTVVVNPFASASGQSGAAILGVINNTALTTSNHLIITYSVAQNTYLLGDSFNGFLGTPTVDKTSSGFGLSTAAAATSATTTTANELIWAHTGVNGSSTTFTVGGGYTFTGVAQGYDANCVGRAEYQIVSATGPFTGPMTLSVSHQWTTTLVTLFDPFVPRSLVAGGNRDMRARVIPHLIIR